MNNFYIPRAVQLPKRYLVLASCLVLAACGGSPSDTGSAVSNVAGQVLRVSQAAQCALSDEKRMVGDGIDAPGRLNVDSPPVVATTGACADNTAYQFGVGIYDITGVIADTSSPAWVNPQQVFNAVHTRVYSRAFAIQSACNNRRIMFVSLDTGLMSTGLRNAVLAEVAADPELAPHYDGRNIMLSVTHTHSDPNTGLTGDPTGLAIITGGTIAAIRNAHSNLTANPASGSLALASGELLNTNINRSKPAFLMNAESERREFLDSRGEEVQVNKQMIQLEFYRSNVAAGLINWFGIHPTVIGPTQSLVSGDVKGEASLGFEKLMGTDYTADPATGTFVSAFAQADEGDSSPNILIEQFPHPDPRRGGGENDLDSNAISALKQFAKAVEIFGSGNAITGPVDFRLFTIPIIDITVEDPVVLASLNHPDELDAAVKKTCSGALGPSFGGGAEDGPGPGEEGIRCDSDPDALGAAFADFDSASNLGLEGFPGGFPRNATPIGNTFSVTAGCNVGMIPTEAGDFSCHAEKPILLPRGGSTVRLQMFRIGQLVVLGVPWEVTTISARRIKTLLLQELAPAGVDTIVIAGLVNDYTHYLTTREEYASQQYEGASNIYGPWSLAVVSQEALKMARAIKNGTELDSPPAISNRISLTPSDGPTEAPNPAGSPGDVITQPTTQVSQGDTVTALFVAGHPRNNLRLQQSYAYIERQNTTGGWEVIVEDRDPSLIYAWLARNKPSAAGEYPISSDGNGEVQWAVPGSAIPGTYRVRVVGSSRSSGALIPYEGISDNFVISDPAGDCP
jgi:neutral ceramidase